MDTEDILIGFTEIITALEGLATISTSIDRIIDSTPRNLPAVRQGKPINALGASGLSVSGRALYPSGESCLLGNIRRHNWPWLITVLL